MKNEYEFINNKKKLFSFEAKITTSCKVKIVKDVVSYKIIIYFTSFMQMDQFGNFSTGGNIF